MRVGIAHPALRTDSPAELFARAAEAGADGVEVHYPSDALASALADPEHVAELKDAAESASVAVAGLYLGCLCQTPSLIGRPEVIQTGQALVLRALGCAAEAGAEVVTVPFFGRNAIEIENELNRAADALLELADHAEEAGVVLAVESTLPFHQAEFLLNYTGNTGSLKIACNTGVALSRKLDLPTGIRQLRAEALALVRFRDVRLAEGVPPDFDVPLGDGDVDFSVVAQALRAVGFDGWVLADPPCPDQPDPAAAAAAVQFVRSTLQAAAV